MITQNIQTKPQTFTWDDLVSAVFNSLKSQPNHPANQHLMTFLNQPKTTPDKVKI